MSDLTHEEQAKRILQKYDPKMVRILPSMMKKFEGKEAQLVSMLVKKHGPVPTDAELAELNSTTTTTPTPTAAAATAAKPPSRQPSPKRTPTAAAGTGTTPMASPLPGQKSPNARPRSPSANQQQQPGKKAPPPRSPPSGQPTTTTPRPENNNSNADDPIEAQCKRLLEKYDPKMVKVLPSMMKKFEGKEQSLLNMLVKKHGPVPPLEASSRPSTPTPTPTKRPVSPNAAQQQQQTTPRAVSPQKRPHSASTASASSKPAAAVPPPQQQQQQQQDTIESQCKRLLEKYDPKMVKVLPSMLKKFEGKEQSLLNMLVKKHGPVPPLEQQQQSSLPSSRATTPVKKAPPPPITDKDGRPLPSSPPSTTNNRQSSNNNNNNNKPSIEDQVRAILEHKDAKMVKVLPSMMKKFEGKEQTLLNMMCKKHNVTADQAYQWASGQNNNNDDEFSDEEEEEFFEEEEEEEEQQEHQRPQPKPQASTPQTVAPQQQPQQQQSQQQQRPRGASTSANQAKPTTTSTTTTTATTAASSDPNFIQLVLNAHNTLRQKHNAPPLQYDTDCEASAEKCANYCQQIGKMEHSFHEPTSTTDKQKHGQNLYWHSRKANVADAVNDWYSEIHNPGIDFENPEPAKKGTGHASQVLWKGTTKVGAAFSDDGKYFVCNYFSAGNVRTKYKENLSPSSSSAEPQQQPKEEVQQQQQQQQRPRGQSQARPRGASTVKQHQEQQQQQLEPLTPQQLLSLRSDLRIRLLRYFQQHDPAKILAVDAELNKYFNPSSPNPEQDFWRDLGRHYPQYGAGGDPRSAISSSSPDRQLVLDRIRRMYVHYDPTVLSSDLPAAMKEFGNGREIELLKILIKRYGPEPENLDHLTEEEQEEYYQSHSSNASQKPQSINNITVAAVPLAHRPAYSRLTNPDQRRAFNMYRHYDPLCLEQQQAPGGGSGESQFDRMMKQYHGREFEWVEDLKKIYGPEPIPKMKNKSNKNVHSSLSKLNDATARGNSLTESETHRRIRNMYQHYDPDEMRNLPIVLERYSGDEPKLLKDLITRYGPEPPLREVPDPEVLQQRAANVVSHYDPESSGKVPELLQRFKGREDQLLRTLVRRYGPEPLESLGTLSANEAAIPPTVSENIAEIRELVSKHEPESAPAIPGLLQRYSGKEETLLQLLRQRYGTSILVEDPTNTNNNNNNNNNSRQRAVSFVDGAGVLQQEQEEDPRIKGSVMSIENRIRRILEVNQPDVAANPEAFAKLMKEHEGKEDEYLKELVALHGPEPEISSTTTNNKKPKFDHPKEASARQKLTALFTHYDRMQLPRIDEWLEKYTGREDQMLADVHKKYALPPPQEPPVWIQPLQKLCLAHGMQETFLEKLISSMGSAATKDNVTFELLNIWYPDFVSSLLTDEGQRRTLTAKRLARFLSVVAPGRVPEVPEMLHQVVSGGQSSDVVLGDMLLTFYRDAMMNAVVPRLDHSSLREKDDAYHQSKQQQEGKSVGAGFIGNVEQLKKLLDVWHQQRHHTRTVPQLLGTSATDLIRFPKVLHRAVGPDELLVKPVRTLGTDTETDSGQVYGSGMPMDGRTLDHDDASSMMRNQSQKNKKDHHQNEGPSEPPPNPLLFSRFGIKNEDIPRTRWGCPNCEALRDFTEQNESRWQARFKEQEVKLWKLLQEQTNRESQTKSQQQQSASPPQQQQQQPCNKCPILNKEIENLRHRAHQLQTRYDNRATLDSAVQQYEKEQQQQQQRNADGTSTSTSNSSQQQQQQQHLQRYATPRRLFQIEHPAPVATNRYNYLSQQQSSTANRDLVPLYHTNATSPSSLRQPSSTLQRSQELWSTLYNNSNNSSSGNNDNNGGGVILPSSEAAKKVLSML